MPADAVFEIVWGKALDGCLPCREGGGTVVGMEEFVPAGTEMFAHWNAGVVDPLPALIVAIAVRSRGEDHAGDGFENLAVGGAGIVQRLYQRTRQDGGGEDNNDLGKGLWTERGSEQQARQPARRALL